MFYNVVYNAWCFTMWGVFTMYFFNVHLFYNVGCFTMCGVLQCFFLLHNMGCFYYIFLQCGVFYNVDMEGGKFPQEIVWQIKIPMFFLISIIFIFSTFEIIIAILSRLRLLFKIDISQESLIRLLPGFTQSVLPGNI